MDRGTLRATVPRVANSGHVERPNNNSSAPGFCPCSPAPVQGIFLNHLPLLLMGFPGGSDGKESACNAGDLGSITGLGRSPGEGKSYPLQYSSLENSMDRGVFLLCLLMPEENSMAGYSPWGCKESDMTERLSVLLISSPKLPLLVF